MNTHINERIAERVTDSSLQRKIYNRCELLAKRMSNKKSFAIRVALLEERQGAMTFITGGGGDSNGDSGVVIIRNGRLHTFMWRRTNQPHTAKALRVDVASCFQDVCTHEGKHS